jgi:hypothetical protein
MERIGLSIPFGPGVLSPLRMPFRHTLENVSLLTGTNVVRVMIPGDVATVSVSAHAQRKISTRVLPLDDTTH